MRVLIGIDDTDNLESRGTGYCARRLGELVEAETLAVVESITRHQLLVDARIPYTSHNSSACLAAEVEPDKLDCLTGFCRDYLVRESATGADAGLCLAAWEKANEPVQAFGRRAKREVLDQAAALDLAGHAGLCLEGLTGTKGGMIGALAAVGLRAEGNDGRCLWLRGLRELEGVCTAGELRQRIRLDGIESVSGAGVPEAARIDVSVWPRPILRAGRFILLVEEANDHDHGEWRVARKEIIKQYSD
jgi:hypothetical protein